MTGWISVHRSLLEHWIWSEKPFSKGQAWVDMLLMANHTDKKTLFDGALTEVKRGGKITSLRKLSERWGWSTWKVKSFLSLLESDGMITYKTNTKRTTYNIVNYSVWQDDKRQQPNTDQIQTKYRPNTDQTQTKTNNNDNNINNDNNENKATAGISYADIKSTWNSIDGIPKIRTMTEKRKSHIRSRVRETDLDTFYQMLDKVRDSEFFKDPSKTWLSFDWVINPDNYTKILEGKYDYIGNPVGKPKRQMRRKNNVYSEGDSIDINDLKAILDKQLQNDIERVHDED